MQDGWNQSYPDSGCYTKDFTPDAGTFDSFENLDFGNWQPVSVTACKVRDADGNLDTTDDQTYIAGWPVALTEEGVVTKEGITGENGCLTWSDLAPHAGEYYDIHEGSWAGWVPLGDPDYVFPADSASSDSSLSHTFYNTYFEGCTPGFWQGGSTKNESAGGQWLWNTDGFFTGSQSDPDWLASGGALPGNPYNHADSFEGYFGGAGSDDMWYYINPDLWGQGNNDDYHKAARDLVAAYLNASWGVNYPYTTTQLKGMWADAVLSGDFASLHNTLDTANNAQVDTNGDGVTEHLCPISAGGY